MVDSVVLLATARDCSCEGGLEEGELVVRAGDLETVLVAVSAAFFRAGSACKSKINYKKSTFVDQWLCPGLYIYLWKGSFLLNTGAEISKYPLRGDATGSCAVGLVRLDKPFACLQ